MDNDPSINLKEFTNYNEHVDKMKDIKQGMLTRRASNREEPTTNDSENYQLLAKIQPNQHEKNKTFFNKLCTFFTENQDLTEHERR